MPKKYPDIICCLLLILLPSLLLWRVVYGHDVLLPADLLRDLAPWRAPTPQGRIPWTPLQWDSMAEFYPWRLFAAQSLRHGWIPLWNPHELCGTPFIANSQSAVFYPLNLLFLIMPVARAFGFCAWLQLALTGMFLYGFLRSGALGLSPPAALLGGIVWQLSAWQVSWLALPTFLCVSCWLPLACWLVWRACDTGGRKVGRWAAVGVCLGVMILGGHLQIAFYCLALVMIYALYLIWPLKRLPLGVFLALGIMIGISAPQVLPTVELARVSNRSATLTTWASYQNYTKLALPLPNLITLWLPGFYGNPTQGTYWGEVANGGPSAYMENACYIGIVSLALVFFGVTGTWKVNRQTRFFTLAALAALLMALGTPLDALPFFGLPGFSQSASPGRILVLWAFCAALLAAVGLEALLAKTPVSRKTVLEALGAFAAVSAAVVGGTLLWIQQDGPQGVLAVNLPRVGALWRVPLGLLVGIGALVWLCQRGSLRRPAMGYLMAGLAALDLLAAGWGFNHTVPPAAVYPVTPGIAYLQTHLGTNRVLILNNNWSLDAQHPPDALLPPNAAMAYGLNEVAGYDSLLTRRCYRFVAALDGGVNPAPVENGNMVFTRDDRSPLVDSAAAAYIASPTPLAGSDLALVSQAPEMLLYQNPQAKPLVRLTGGEGNVQIIHQAPSQLTIRVQSPSQAQLVVADQWYPGWQATVNGASVPIALSGRMFQQVALSKGGTSLVQMRYQPTAFRLGLYGYCLAIGTALAFLASLSGRRGKRATR